MSLIPGVSLLLPDDMYMMEIPSIAGCCSPVAAGPALLFVVCGLYEAYFL